MKTQCTVQRGRAFTLVELLLVIFVVTVLAVLLLPAIVSTGHDGRQGINCVNNLKEIGLAFRVWEGDNGDKYPMEVSITNGGAMELAATGNVVAIFQVMSNELGTPKILTCPQDQKHLSVATDFSDSQLKSKINYFISLDATDTQPQMILCGDDNFAIDRVPVKSGLVQFSTNSNVAWTSGRHVPHKAHFWTLTHGKFFGNICLADGSVQSITSDSLNSALANGTANNRLVIP
jgi:hypothetical protein